MLLYYLFFYIFTIVKLWLYIDSHFENTNTCDHRSNQWSIYKKKLNIIIHSSTHVLEEFGAY